MPKTRIRNELVKERIGTTTREMSKAILILPQTNESFRTKIIGGKYSTNWWKTEIEIKLKEQKVAWRKYLQTKIAEDYEGYKKTRKYNPFRSEK